MRFGRLGFILTFLLLGVALLLPSGSSRAAPVESVAGGGTEFFEIMPAPGFGDPHNNGAWSMEWWNGKLYVGTVRDFTCWSAAAAHASLPFIPYPPVGDPDLGCPEDPYQMPLRAEIWRFTPETLLWERVYRSPATVPAPDDPDTLVARDIGFRDMVVYTEPGGVEALYVGGVFPRTMWPDPAPLPRLLRSTDGVNFAPVPTDPGTVLGNINKGSFSRLEVHDGRLYVIAGLLRGDGAVYESTDPAGGNDNWRRISPVGLSIFEMASFNGELYFGLNLDAPGGGNAEPTSGAEDYSVMRAVTGGAAPYPFLPVLPEGGYLERETKQNIVSMHVFEGRLYVGTDAPAELYRFNPDNSWDLVVGTGRSTPTGFKAPLSGYGPGFDWGHNIHLWRMMDFDGRLYVGTYDLSRNQRFEPGFAEQYGHLFGLDLYSSDDGSFFTVETVDGFGDEFQVGARSMAATPDGLYIGGINLWGGFKLWRQAPLFRNYLPLQR